MDEYHVGQLVAQRAKSNADRPAIAYRDMQKGEWKTLSWKQYDVMVEAAARSLVALGIGVQDRVAIFAQNMVETTVVDFGCAIVRGVQVPTYATSSSSQIEYIVNDAQTKVIFVGEQYQFDQVAKFVNENKFLEKVVTIDKNINANGLSCAITFEEFLKLGDNDECRAEVERRRAELSDDDLAMLIYTSGTTGEPKGVMLHHSNFIHAIHNHDVRLDNFKRGDNLTSLAFLPFSHIFEHAWFYLCMNRMVLVYVNQNPKEILKTLSEVHPNMMCAVPRFWEKVYDGVHEKIDSFPAPLAKLAYHAIEIGRKYNIEHRAKGIEPSALLSLRYKFYEATLFKMLKKVIGFDKGTFFPCAGSQTSEKVNSFIHSVGINLIVGYGLTETTATVSCYNPYNKNYELRTAGEIMPGLEYRVGEDRELLLKGETITKGYYNKPEANKSSFTEDGFFKTGDAVEIVHTEHGDRIVVIERIKELFKTSNGKYIAPQMVEMHLEGDLFISQSAVIADQRKYVTALIVPEWAKLEGYAKENGISFSSRAELIKDSRVIDLYTKKIAECVKDLAAYEQVKYFTLIDKPFSPDDDTLTLSLKLKRRVINKIYASQIEAMYQN